MIKPSTWDGDDVLAVIVLSAIACFIGVATWASIAALRADGHVDHCYVEHQEGAIPAFVVTGHRAWRSDVTMAAELTSDAAQAKLVAMCPTQH